MRLTFLGTSGYYPLYYQTSCALVGTKKANFILDAGTGICKLAGVLDVSKPTFLLLSHFHLDHTVGLTYLRNAFKGSEITIAGQPGTERNVRTLLSKPFFGAPIEKSPFRINFKEMKDGPSDLGDAKITAKFLVHSDPVYGYRIEEGGKTVCYCTDTAPGPHVEALAAGADLLIHEAYFGESDSKSPGSLSVHSSPKTAAQSAKKAGVEKLFLFHFNPEYDKKAREEMEREAKAVFSDSHSSYDGISVEIR